MATFVNIGKDDETSYMLNVNYIVELKPDRGGTLIIMHDNTEHWVSVPLGDFMRRIPALEIVWVQHK